MRTVRESAGLEFCHLHSPSRLVTLDGMEAGLPRFRAAELNRLQTSVNKLETALRIRCGLGQQPITRIGLLDDIAVRESQRVSNEPSRWEFFTGISRESLAQVTGGAVYDESQFIFRGRELQKLLLTKARENNLQIADRRRITIPTSAGTFKFSIAGFEGVDDASAPSCAVLDLAWTEWRTQQFEQTITTLPAKYMRQQQQVAALAALIELPRRETVRSVLLDGAGEIVNEIRFGEFTLLR